MVRKIQQKAPVNAAKDILASSSTPRREASFERDILLSLCDLSQISKPLRINTKRFKTKDFVQR
jgi:hypothetical protein